MKPLIQLDKWQIHNDMHLYMNKWVDCHPIFLKFMVVLFMKHANLGWHRPCGLISLIWMDFAKLNSGFGQEV